jgi:flavin reductase (DIM6/NTAB) family NADH-FMN oxidoreductase RutF
MTDAANLLESPDRELWIVTARAGQSASGLVATFVTGASIVPDIPRAIVGLAKQHCTWELVEANGAFALHLIDEAHIDWVWRFGLQSGRDTDKLAGLDWHTGATGSPLLDKALGWLDCRVEDRVDAGDRTIYLAEVVAAQSTPKLNPLTVRRMLELAAPEQMQELKRQRGEDARRDAEAIRAWRSGRTGASPAVHTS